jgi:hypothetical protein
MKQSPDKIYPQITQMSDSILIFIVAAVGQALPAIAIAFRGEIRFD